MSENQGQPPAPPTPEGQGQTPPEQPPQPTEQSGDAAVGFEPAETARVEIILFAAPMPHRNPEAVLDPLVVGVFGNAPVPGDAIAGTAMTELQAENVRQMHRKASLTKVSVTLADDLRKLIATEGTEPPNEFAGAVHIGVGVAIFLRD